MKNQGLVYEGGSISCYHVRQINETFMRMHLVVLTGWQVDSSICTAGCDSKEINYNNTNPGAQLTVGGHAVSYGKWTAEKGRGSSYETEDLTNFIQKNSLNYVIAVNKQDNWKLVVTEFDYDFDMTADYTDITLSGPKWRPYFHDGQTSSQIADLQIKVQPKIRNDTGLPNSTPVTIFKPVYRLPLNQVSFINLAPVDPDGDAVICEEAAYVSAGGIRSPANITIHRDCRIEVAAFESAGYTDGEMAAVAVVMTDYNREPITMGGGPVLKPYFRYLSQLSIQFMIHTMKTVNGPQFIDPTPKDKQVFEMEVNTLLNMTLAVQSNSSLDTFHVSTLPYADFQLTSDSSNTGHLSWRPTHKDVGTYVIHVRASDVNGDDSTERTFVIHVRDREPFTILPHPTESDYAFVPTIATFQCRDGDSCLIAVPAITTFQLDTVTGENGVDVVEWQGPYVSMPGTQRYQIDVRLEGMTPGKHVLCLKLADSSSGTEKDVCVNVNIYYRDPCETIPCQHYGECVSSKGQFTCNCLATYTGTVCEKVIDVCSPSPCVHGKCYNTFSGPSSYYCQCDPGYSGANCDEGAQTTPALSTVPQTTHTCENKVGVNCPLLDTTTKICESPIGPKYCEQFCKLC